MIVFGNKKDTYYLMNKDRKVATFQKEDSMFDEDASFVVLESNPEELPIGFSDITTWLEGRKASKHNSHLKEVMERLNCAQSEGFIKVTHATSINDTFWVKKEGEVVAWSDVSLYQNEFTESISALALEGVGLYNEVFSPTALPEFVSEGSFPKCFTKENQNIYIYKGGSVKYANAGMEPYSEVLAAEIASMICSEAVDYKLARLHGKLASKCLLFTGEEYGYTPFRNLTERGKVVTLDGAFRYFANIGSENAFREMLLVDALTFNTDRHPGNYGVLFQNDTLQIEKMAPVFDLNLSLFPYLMSNDFTNIGDNMLKYAPVLGGDFTRLGQQMLTPSLREKVSNLSDFAFSFRGDSKFTEDRVKILEGIIQKQAKAVLKGQKLHTKDVFIPETANEIKLAAKEKYEEVVFLADKIDSLELPLLVSVDNDSNRAVVIVEDINSNFSLECDVINKEINCFRNFKRIFTKDLTQPEFDIFIKIQDLFLQKEFVPFEQSLEK